MKKLRQALRLGSPQAWYAFPLAIGLLWAVLQLGWMYVLSLTLNTPGGLREQLVSWDGQWYTSIIRNGYQAAPILSQANVAFFPLYPMLVGALHALGIPLLVAGVGLSLSAFLAYLVVLYRLVTRLASEALARWAVVLQVCVPFSFFFTMVYTESFFLLLCALFFYLLYRRQPYWAAVIAGLASGTRVTGLLLGVVLITWLISQAYRDRSLQPATWAKAGLLGLISCSGLLAFMLFLNVRTDDPLAFVTVQQYWGRAEGFGFLLVEIKRMVLEVKLASIYGLILIGWYGMTIVGLVAAAVLLQRRQLYLALFMALTLIIPLASGTATSMNRYVAGALPFAIALAYLSQNWRYRYRWLLAAAMVLAGLVFTAVFMLESHPFIG